MRNSLAKEPRRYLNRHENASLTVEAAIVMPLFLFFMLTFLYFIQIITVQEQIQSAITELGFNLSKTAYVFEDFPVIEDALSFDETIFGTDFEIGLTDFVKSAAEGSLLRIYARKYFDIGQIDRSCIQNGYKGITFFCSGILDGEDYIDIIVRYQVHIPIKIFNIGNMRMIQRVRVRAWTGHQVEAAYSMGEGDKDEEDTVYITETGSVYHTNETCSHIKLSVMSVNSIPSNMKNENGISYTACEACCNNQQGVVATYYITLDGTKYHTKRDCSKIKRTVKAIKRSEAGNRTLCKRCKGK